MSRALAIVRADKLNAQTRCPACGDPRVEVMGAKGSPVAITVFKCSAEFLVDVQGAIIPSIVCPSSSYVAARALNDEALTDVRKKVGAA